MRKREPRTHDGVWLHPLEDPGLLCDVQQRAVFEYWLAMRAENGLPTPSKIDPVQLPRGCLPFVMVKEHEPDSGRFRTRLAGTAFRNASGFDGTNIYSDQLTGSAGTIDRFTWAVVHRQPYWYQGSLAFSVNDFKQFSVLVLPFAEPDLPVSRLLCVFDFNPETGPTDE